MRFLQEVVADTSGRVRLLLAYRGEEPFKRLHYSDVTWHS